MANMKLVNSVIKLRRDNDYNYNKVKDTFIPSRGEVCLVDTARQGLCAVVGDGISTYGELKYVNSIFEKVYFIGDKIYEDKEYTIEFIPNVNKIYIDIGHNNSLYYYNGEEFVLLQTGDLPIASELEPGIMKLYNTTGKNIDGTMTQKAISDELGHKLTASVDLEEENIIFK